MTQDPANRPSSDLFSGPCPLEVQRELAREAGFTLLDAPDAPRPDDLAPDFDAATREAGTAIFVRDYNLPIYPNSRVTDAELAAPAVVEAARGQVEPLSIALHAIEDLHEVEVGVSSLTREGGGELPPVRVRVLEPAYVRSAPGSESREAILGHLRLWPNQPVSVAAGMNRQFWLEVTVPIDAAPGEYTGEICVRSAGRCELRRELTARVRPFTLAEPENWFLGAFMTLRYCLPDRETLADFKAHGIDGMLWFWSEAAWNVYRSGESIVQYFHPITRVIEDAMAVGMKGPIVIGLGNDTVGFYERRLCQEFNRPLAPAEPVDGKTAQVAAMDDEVINRLYIEGVRQLLEVARSRGWPEIIILHYDEPTERLVPEATHRYKQLKAAFPNLRIYGVTMNRSEWAEQLAPMSDILVCNGSFEEIRELARREGKDCWGYSGAPASVGAGGSRFNMGLRLWKYGFGAHWFWCYNFYSGHPWNEFTGRTGNANWVTVYPGLTPGKHIPTLAWEGMLQAHNDVRYCATLEKLLAERTGALRDRIAAQFETFRAEIPAGRDRTSFGVDQDDFYSTLPSYHRLTAMRAKVAGWIGQLAEAD
jgi:hypothetical protein